MPQAGPIHSYCSVRRSNISSNMRRRIHLSPVASSSPDFCKLFVAVFPRNRSHAPCFVTLFPRWQSRPPTLPDSSPVALPRLPLPSSKDSALQESAPRAGSKSGWSRRKRRNRPAAHLASRAPFPQASMVIASIPVNQIFLPLPG